ncbi:MAG: hypothetical protein JKY54_04655 [Flavobacteriales bacterium]|nr:hypothetical protein [Flavobacteriales bacterium]
MFDNISPINNNYISDNTIDVLLNKEGVSKYNISEIYNKFNGLDKTYDKKNIICFNSFMNNKYSNILSNFVVLDAGLSNKNNAPIFSNIFGFRLPANMLSYNIMTLHNLIMYFIAGIVYFTLFAIGDIIYKFSYCHFRGIKSYNNSKKTYDINIVHSSLME